MSKSTSLYSYSKASQNDGQNGSMNMTNFGDAVHVVSNSSTTNGLLKDDTSNKLAEESIMKASAANYLSSTNPFSNEVCMAQIQQKGMGHI